MKSVHHSVRYFASLAVAILCYFAYLLLIVPYVEGEPSLVRSNREIHAGHADPKQDILNLFPPNAWELQPCNVLETQQGKLLFQNHKRLEDGRVEITPLTLVIGSGSADEQPFVIQAEEGAILEFDKPFSFAGGIGNIEQGILQGRVRIYRLSSDLLRDDSIEIETYNVQLSTERIFTLSDVAFRMGASHGRGRKLSVDLHQKSLVGEKPQFPVKKLELAEVDYVHIDREPTQPRDMFDPLNASHQGIFRTSESETGPRSSALGLAGSQSSQFSSIDITCASGFQLDLENLVASFKDDVRVFDGTGSNQLTCDQLWIYFVANTSNKTNPSEGPSPSTARTSLTAAQSSPPQEGVDHGTDSTSQSLVMQKIVALGRPAQMLAHDRDAFAEAEHLQIDLDQNRVLLRGQRPVRLHSELQQMVARELDYVIQQDNSLGETIAQGPGYLVQKQTHSVLPDGTTKVEKRGFECRWQGRMTIRPDQKMKLIEFASKAQMLIDDESTLEGDQIKFWIWEIATASNPDQPASWDASDLPGTAENKTFRYEPHRLVANGNVVIDSPKLAGKCNAVEVSWPQSKLAERALPALTPSVVERSEGLTAAIIGRSRATRAFVSKRIAETAMRQDRMRPNDDTKYHFVGDDVRIQMDESETKSSSGQSIRASGIAELNANGNVHITQYTLQNDQAGLEIRGESLQAIHLGEQLYRLSINGNATQSAVAEGEGIRMSGSAIHLDQQYNRLWIDGAGDAKLNNATQPSQRLEPSNSPRGFLKQSTTEPSSRLPNVEPGKDDSQNGGTSSDGPTDLKWNGGMVFDGQTFYVEGNVETLTHRLDEEGKTTVIQTTSEALNAKLDQFISFKQQNSAKGITAKVENIVLAGEIKPGGNVFQTVSINRSTPARQTGLVMILLNQMDQNHQPVGSQQIYVPDAIIDSDSGAVNCTGPGAVQGIQQARSQPAGANSRPINQQRGQTQPYEYIQVKFERSLAGNIHQKEMTFSGNVRLVYTPTSKWDSVYDADSKQIVDPGGMRLLSDRLQVFQWKPRTALEPVVEMIAKGNAQAFGQQFEASADRISYNQATESIILQAGARRDAELFYQKPDQTDKGHLTAETINYNVETGAVQVDRYKQIDVNHQGPLRKRD